MKHTIILLSVFGLLGISQDANAQQIAFEKFINTCINVNNGFSLVKKPNGNFWASMQSNKCVPNEGCAKSACILSLDGNGTPIYGRKYGNGQDYSAYDFIYTSDGSWLMTGHSGMLTKSDTLGNVLWAKYFGVSTPNTPVTLEGTKVIETGGNYFMIAYSFGDSYSLIVNLDPAGNVNWYKILGVSNNSLYALLDGAPDGAGGIFALALVDGQPDYIQVLHIDATGAVTGTFNYSNNVGSWSNTAQLEKTPAGNYVITNNAVGHFVTFCIDPQGAVLWTSRVSIPGNPGKRPHGMAVDYSGNIVLCGEYGSQPYTSGYVYLLGPNGNYKWGKTFGTPGASENVFRGVACTDDCGYMLTGLYEDSTSYYQTWLMKIDSLGNPGYTGTSLGATASYTSPVIMTTATHFEPNYTFSHVPYTPYTANSGATVYTIAQGLSTSLCSPQTGIATYNLNDGGGIYPNPASDYFTLDIAAGEANSNLVVYALSGQVVFSQRLTASGPQQFSVSATGLSSGIYMLKIQSEKRARVLKLVVAD